MVTFLGHYYYRHVGLRPTYSVFCGTILPADPVYVNDNLAFVRFQSYQRVNAARNFLGFSLDYKSGTASQGRRDWQHSIIDSPTVYAYWFSSDTMLSLCLLSTHFFLLLITLPDSISIGQLFVLSVVSMLRFYTLSLYTWQLPPIRYVGRPFTLPSHEKNQ